MPLYNINENDVIYELSIINEKSVLRDGKFEVIEKSKTYYKYKYPLKIIFEKQKSEFTVITVYPLKGGKK